MTSYIFESEHYLEVRWTNPDGGDSSDRFHPSQYQDAERRALEIKALAQDAEIKERPPYQNIRLESVTRVQLPVYGVLPKVDSDDN